MEIWKALVHLFPNAQPGVDYVLRDDGKEVVIDIDAWRLSAPIPDAAQLDTASTAYDSQQPVIKEQAQQIRAGVKQSAAAVIGKRFADLTAADVRALLAVVLWRNGGIAPDTTIRPFDDWN